MKSLSSTINEAMRGLRTFNESDVTYNTVKIGGKNPIEDIDFEDATFQDFINFCDWVGLKSKDLQKAVLKKYKATDSLEDIDADMYRDLKDIYMKMSRQRIKAKFVSEWLEDIGGFADLYDAWFEWRKMS